MTGKAIDPARRGALDAGTAETRNLAECLVVDQAMLARAVLPGLGFGNAAEAVAETAAASRSRGISRQIAAIGAAVATALGQAADPEALSGRLAAHPSDTVQSWAAFAAGRGGPETGLGNRLDAMRRFAADRHFGVREWAWLAVRPSVAADIEQAIALLESWVHDPDPNIRRFAVEGTRPRGVWCEHIHALKQDPSPGAALLEPLRGDPARYVQDSVANWLNDAGKTRPDWVRDLCARWERDAGPETLRIIARALRTIRK